ncbi:MAG TPA: DeoR/GlpR transcriptional regulator [Anaerolineaceae bacterium]|nr:DeoR/GlpR transcriptional regulator [Anaerolineaceae bacterium]
MISEDRTAFILKEIEDRGSVNVVNLAQRLDVSEMTIRRDLVSLEKEGLIRRVHGGAISARGRSYEPSLVLRETQNREEKALIGRIAASLVADGDCIALDIGSTTLQVAINLIGRRNLTVITPSLQIANALANQPDIRLIIPGGIVRHGELSLIGDLTRRSLEGLFIDRLFLGVGAIDSEHGLTEYNWDDALVKKEMVQNAKEVILVADPSKFEKVAFASVAPLNAIHMLVTTQLPPTPLQEALQKDGVLIMTGDEEDDGEILEKEQRNNNQ